MWRFSPYWHYQVERKTMRHTIHSKCSLLASFALLASVIISFVLVNPVSAQTTKPDDWKSKLTAEERSEISKPESPNDRMKTYLRLAQLRLKNAREQVSREDFTAADEQLEGYTALIADAGDFSKNSVPKRDKAHKTLETSLREQVRTLEGLKRDISSTRAEAIEKALKIANHVRRQALNLLLGDGGFLSETDKP